MSTFDLDFNENLDFVPKEFVKYMEKDNEDFNFSEEYNNSEQDFLMLFLIYKIMTSEKYNRYI